MPSDNQRALHAKSRLAITVLLLLSLVVSIKAQGVMAAGAPGFTLPVVGPNGLMGQLGQANDQLILEAYQWVTLSTLTLSLRNTGGTTLNLAAADFYVDGFQQTVTIANPSGGTCTTPTAVGPGTACIVTLTITAVTISSGVAYVIQVDLPDGGEMSYSAIAGSSSQPNGFGVTTQRQAGLAPDFTLPVVGPNGLTGQTVTLSSFRGKIVVLEFMEPWCEHCQNMAPVIEQLNGPYGSNVVFISVSGPWDGATADDTAKFITSYGSTWTYVYDSSGTVFSEYSVNSTPIFYIIGTDGTVSTSLVGEQPSSALAGAISSALSQEQNRTIVYQTGTPNLTAASSQNESLVVPPRYEYYFGFDLNSGDTESFSFSVSSWRGADDIGLTLVSSTGSVLLDVGRVSQYSGNYMAVFPGRYYLRFDNSYSIFTTKTVSLSYSVIPPPVGIEDYQWSGNTITGYIRNYGTNAVDTVKRRRR